MNNIHCLSLIIILFYLTSNFIQISAVENNTFSIRLCCNPSEYFNTSSRNCQNLSTDFSLTTWDIRNFWSIGVAEKVNILRDLEYSVGMFCQKPVVYKFFEYKNDSEHCYSPYYHKQKQKYIIATLDCDFTAQAYIFIYDTYLLGIGISSIFILLTLVLYMKLKDLSHIMDWKLFLCYAIAWMCSHLLVIVCICLMCIEMVSILWFCFTSSRLWLNVVGYEVWLHFKYSFKDYDLQRASRRFLFYSLYVWGVAILSTLSCWILKDLSPRETWPSYISTTVILLLSFVTFAYIICKLFHLRLKVINTAKGKHFIRKSVRLIVGIFHLMIISWILFLLWLLYPRNIIIIVLFYAHLIVEGPILFGLFVPTQTLWVLCYKRSNRRNSYDKANDLMEEMQTLS